MNIILTVKIVVCLVILFNKNSVLDLAEVEKIDKKWYNVPAKNPSHILLLVLSPYEL